jgi:phage repressor protein C with HTH and peptisase S24 domain
MNSLQHQNGAEDTRLSTPFWRMGGRHQFGAQERVIRGNNIAALREAKGWKRPQLAKAMGTSTQQVERLEKSQRRLTQDWIERAAAALEVQPVAIFTTGYDALPEVMPERRETVADSDVDTVEIIKLDLSLSMGPGTLIDDWVEETSYHFDPNLLRTITRSPAHRLRLVTGVGDSMYPTLTHGDHIIVDTTERQLARQDGVYWINLHGAAGLKRLRAVGKGKVLVKSDNPQVGDQEVDAEDLRIDGRAVWVMRGL